VCPGVRHDQLATNPDRIRWNARYRQDPPSPRPHPLARLALALELPDGPVADLACGPSGSALLAARGGRRVTAVDVSEVALDLLARAAREDGVADLITLVHADLAGWRPEPGQYALVLCSGFWDRAVFGPATAGVMSGGVLAWQAYTAQARTRRPSLRPEWCLAPGEPASLLPPGFTVMALPGETGPPDEMDAGCPDRRSMLARRG